MQILKLSVPFFASLCYCLSHTLDKHNNASTDQPSTLAQSSGIGFDLSLTHGAAVISHSNGSFTELARYEGSAEYKYIMQQLSSYSSQHLHPPYDSTQDRLSDSTRQLKRKLRKFFGQPASVEVGVIAELMEYLTFEVHYRTGRRVTQAAAAFPHLPGLYAEDISDVFDYLRIKEVPYWGDGDQRQLMSSVAVWGGSGHGLCKDYLNATACRNEMIGMKPHLHWSIGLHDDALEQAAGFAYSFESDVQRLDMSSVDYDMPFRRRDEDWYMIILERKLMTFIESIKGEWYIPGRSDGLVVQLYGQQKIGDRVVDVVNSALKKVWPRAHVVEVLDDLYIAAKGAAEWAKRHGEYESKPHYDRDWFESKATVVDQQALLYT